MINLDIYCSKQTYFVKNGLYQQQKVFGKCDFEHVLDEASQTSSSLYFLLFVEISTTKTILS